MATQPDQLLKTAIKFVLDLSAREILSRDETGGLRALHRRRLGGDAAPLRHAPQPGA